MGRDELLHQSVAANQCSELAAGKNQAVVRPQQELLRDPAQGGLVSKKCRFLASMRAIKETDNDEQADGRFQARGGADRAGKRFAPSAGAADLGVGHSTLNRWVKAFGDAVTAPGKESELVNEIERLRRELRIVTEEREVPKKAAVFFAGQKRWGLHSFRDILARFAKRVCASCSMSARAGCAPGDSDRPASVSATTWCCCAYPRTTASEPGQLWAATHDGRAEGTGPACWRAAGRQADEEERDLCRANKEIQAHDRQRS